MKNRKRLSLKGENEAKVLPARNFKKVAPTSVLGLSAKTWQNRTDVTINNSFVACLLGVVNSLWFLWALNTDCLCMDNSLIPITHFTRLTSINWHSPNIWSKSITKRQCNGIVMMVNRKVPFSHYKDRMGVRKECP